MGKVDDKWGLRFPISDFGEGRWMMDQRGLPTANCRLPGQASRAVGASNG